MAGARPERLRFTPRLRQDIEIIQREKAPGTKRLGMKQKRAFSHLTRPRQNHNRMVPNGLLQNRGQPARKVTLG